jgi:hypothetical protein
LPDTIAEAGEGSEAAPTKPAFNSAAAITRYQWKLLSRTVKQEITECIYYQAIPEAFSIKRTRENLGGDEEWKGEDADKATNSLVGLECAARIYFLCVFGASLMRTVAGDKKYINGSSSGAFRCFLE